MQFQSLFDSGRDLLEKGKQVAAVAVEKSQQAAAVAVEKGQQAAAVAVAKGQEAVQAAQDLAAGTKIVTVEDKQYQLTGLIAEGGYAYVYRARDPVSGDRFAIKKVLAQDAESAKIAKIEMDFLRTLPVHPNIIRFYGGAKQPASNGQGHEHLFVLELCRGGALTKYVKPGAKPLRESAVLAKFVDTCKGVAHLHSQQPPIQHRDLKLENVLEAGQRGTCKLCDFGSVSTTVLDCATASRRERLDEEDLISRYTTAWNRAPEMIDMHRGQRIDVAVDAWALGCLLFTLSYRKHPFDTESPLQILNNNYEIPADAPGRSGELANLIISMLEPDPAKRPSVFAITERAALLYAEAMAGDLTPAGEFDDGYDAMGGAAPDGFTDDGGGFGGPPRPKVSASDDRRASSFENLMEASTSPVVGRSPLGSSPLAGVSPQVARRERSAASKPPPDLMGGGGLVGGAAAGGSGIDLLVADAPPPPAAEGWADFASFGGAPASTASASADLNSLLGDPAPAPAPASGGGGGGGDGSFWANFGDLAISDEPAASSSPAAPPRPPSPPSPPAVPATPDDFGDFGGVSAAAPTPAPSDDFGCFGAAATATPTTAPAMSMDDFGDFGSVAAAAPPTDFGDFGGMAAAPAPAAPFPAAAAPAQAFALGSTVVVQGLQAKPEHNDKKASVIGFDAAKGRYNVTLTDSGVVLALKPANLAPTK